MRVILLNWKFGEELDVLVGLLTVVFWNCVWLVSYVREANGSGVIEHGRELGDTWISNNAGCRENHRSRIGVVPLKHKQEQERD